MNTENQYDAIAERYDSLFNDKASIRENEQVAYHDYHKRLSSYDH